MMKPTMNHYPRKGSSVILPLKESMGEELCEVDINLTRRLLSTVPWIGWLTIYLLQQNDAKEKMFQIIHCPHHHHWMVAITIRNNRDANNILLYDSIFKKVCRETRKTPCQQCQNFRSSKTNGYKRLWFVCLSLCNSTDIWTESI